jgi:hypothetical protein
MAQAIVSVVWTRRRACLSPTSSARRAGHGGLRLDLHRIISDLAATRPFSCTYPQEAVLASSLALLLDHYKACQDDASFPECAQVAITKVCLAFEARHIYLRTA